MPRTSESKKREYLARRDAWLRDNGPCAMCGSWEALEVDHIDPAEKERPVVTVWLRSKEVREAELAKCQVLCHECHVDKTIAGRGHQRAKHGSPSMYNNYACRCEECRSAWSIYSMERRMRQ